MHYEWSFERLFRYAARPPLAAERLEHLPDGRLLYRFKRVWRNGATHAVFSPLELIGRLAALVPTPRAHLTRYHGILGPAATWRPLIVPTATQAQRPPPDAASDVDAISGNADPASAGEVLSAATARRPRNYAWADLIKRVFSADVLSCDRCGGKIRIVSAIHPPEATRKILECLGLPSRAPPLAPARLERQSTLISEWS